MLPGCWLRVEAPKTRLSGSVRANAAFLGAKRRVMAYWLARSFHSQSLGMFRVWRAPAERVSGMRRDSRKSDESSQVFGAPA
jgi:hypothetical protein